MSQESENKGKAGPERLDWWRALHTDEAEATRRLQRIDIEIAKGTPLLTLARDLIQGEWGIFPKMNTLTLRKRLERHKERSVLMPEGIEEGKQLTAQEKKQAAAALDFTLNVHTELQELAELQKARILRAIDLEQKAGKHYNLWKDVETHTNVLKALGEHQLTIGVLTKAPSLTKVGALPDGTTGIQSNSKLSLHFPAATQASDAQLREVIDAIKSTPVN